MPFFSWLIEIMAMFFDRYIIIRFRYVVRSRRIERSVRNARILHESLVGRCKFCNNVSRHLECSVCLWREVAALMGNEPKLQFIKGESRTIWWRREPGRVSIVVARHFPRFLVAETSSAICTFRHVEKLALHRFDSHRFEKNRYLHGNDSFFV